MIRFQHDFNFPTCWDDYIAQDPGRPSFTIMTRQDYDENPTDDPECSDEDWVNLVLDVPVLTPEVVRRSIAERIGVAPDDVELVYRF